jgi:uncharacterized membrane protein YcjF (UPF0283 family)
MNTNKKTGGITMKMLCLAVCSLGIMYIIAAFTTASWVPVVFGAITAVTAIIGFTQSEK